MAVVRGPLNNTPEWDAIRIGKITGSNFAKVMTGRRGAPNEFGDTALGYALDIAHERITGEKKPGLNLPAFDWGHQYERFAVEEYALRTFYEPEKGCWCAREGIEDIGCSPDGFVGDKGLIEVKCPSSGSLHLATYIDGRMPEQHTWQVQGALWVTERDWCDFISYDPRYPPKSRIFIQRIHRDERSIALLMGRVSMFRMLLNGMVEKAS